ncbi:H-2 class II histocompatibility antigen, A-U alpha chain-like [Engraulis encrasicolus]|uniref:H-2 class II histocompatibility antigen, A-U alpha chain-like n=1 Tax=Engraulis encrasicolus TaxID=184585 RepID=UPI002FD5C9FF
MVVSGIFLILIGIIHTQAKTVHVDIWLGGCSESDGEYMFMLDGEEKAHADWKAGKYVVTVPEFAPPLTFVGDPYQTAEAQQRICKRNLGTFIEAYKNPVVAQAPPVSSIYPRDDVTLGTDNTLICYIADFYPPRLTLRWTKNNRNVTLGVRNSQLRVNDDGSFNMVSSLRFTPAEGDIYTCTVEHSALTDGPQTREFEVEVPPEASVGPSVFCGVGLTLGLLGVATGTFLQVKGNQCN